ncbi:hypothetical protein Tsubulata_004853 [Turnera subulata]|uniref:Uncharacterized protein n=1 Tax=Turnera subulata TaxID=218843 RepID=A0A9Q0JP32_9ROSI|nr:hypothetical protein Tsubulata_004853 [Turnera subulata]
MILKRIRSTKGEVTVDDENINGPHQIKKGLAGLISERKDSTASGDVEEVVFHWIERENGLDELMKTDYDLRKESSYEQKIAFLVGSNEKHEAQQRQIEEDVAEKNQVTQLTEQIQHLTSSYESFESEWEEVLKGMRVEISELVKELRHTHLELCELEDEQKNNMMTIQKLEEIMLEEARERFEKEIEEIVVEAASRQFEEIMSEEARQRFEKEIKEIVVEAASRQSEEIMLEEARERLEKKIEEIVVEAASQQSEEGWQTLNWRWPLLLISAAAAGTLFCALVKRNSARG